MKIMFLLFLIVFSTTINAQVPPPPPPHIVNTLEDNDEDLLKIFVKVEEEAQFPGGDTAWRNFLIRNLNPNNYVDKIVFKRKQKFIQETAIIKFIVSKDGKVSNIVIENEVNPFFAKEALRVMHLSPRWIPAYQNKRNVNAYRRQPITFRVDAE